VRIAVLGTGAVGKALAARLAGLGHEVVVATRDPQSTLARTEPASLGGPPSKVWREAHPEVGLTTPAEATGQPG
jgi:8-hydroxy-5-deazaflavin:NADPH oxidoreductase